MCPDSIWLLFSCIVQLEHSVNNNSKQKWGVFLFMCFLEINFTLFAVVYDATNYMSMKNVFYKLRKC